MHNQWWSYCLCWPTYALSFEEKCVLSLPKFLVKPLMRFVRGCLGIQFFEFLAQLLLQSLCSHLIKHVLAGRRGRIQLFCCQISRLQQVISLSSNQLRGIFSWNLFVALIRGVLRGAERVRLLDAAATGHVHINIFLSLKRRVVKFVLECLSSWNSAPSHFYFFIHFISNHSH